MAVLLMGLLPALERLTGERWHCAAAAQIQIQ